MCKIEDCHGKPIRRGYCSSHYNRWRRYGDPLSGRSYKGEISNFIQNAVLKHEGEECLLWPYAKAGDGYGVAIVNGRRVYVHRYVCEQEHGAPSSSELQAAHRCGNGSSGCVSRRHLRWATPLENTHDKRLHGSIPMGEGSPSAKLTEEQVREIRDLSKALTTSQLAEKFNMSRGGIYGVVSGTNWSHVI